MVRIQLLCPECENPVYKEESKNKYRLRYVCKRCQRVYGRKALKEKKFNLND